MRHVPAAAAHRSSCHALLRADYFVHRPVSCCAVGAAIIHCCPPGALAAAALLQLALRCLLPGGAAGSAHPHTAGQGEAGGSSQCACTDALPNTGTAACKAPVMEGLGCQLTACRHRLSTMPRLCPLTPALAPTARQRRGRTGRSSRRRRTAARVTGSKPNQRCTKWGSLQCATICLLPRQMHAGMPLLAADHPWVAPPLEAPALTLPSSQHAAGAARGRPSTGCPSGATRRRHQCLRGQKAKASLEYALSMGACLPLRSLTAVAAAVV